MTDIQLDSIDRKIIGVLQNDGRTSNADLAENINLSASACHRRVQRLHSTGIIKNYVALLNSRLVGLPTTVFVEITLSGQADEVLDAFERQVQLIPDVLECHLMSGSADYLLKVVAKDTDGDTMHDGWEVYFGLEPLRPSDNFEDILDDVSITFLAKSGIVMTLIEPFVPERDIAAIARP